MREQVTRLLAGVMERGRQEADALKRRRQRSRLVHELGDLCYRHHVGEDTAKGEIEDLVRRIVDLDRSDDGTDGSDSATSTVVGQDETPASTSTSNEDETPASTSTGDEQAAST